MDLESHDVFTADLNWGAVDLFYNLAGMMAEKHGILVDAIGRESEGCIYTEVERDSNLGITLYL